MNGLSSETPTRLHAMPAIRAVAFDLDDTLWAIGPVIARAEQLLYEWLHEHCPRLTERFSLQDLRAARAALAAEEPHRAHDYTYMRRTVLARHALECGYSAASAEQAFEVFHAARNELDLFDDVRPALERLQSRYRLATLSNGNADLKRIGIARYFEASLTAREIGAQKPDSRCFESLARALDLAPTQILFVGDDPLLDIEGARACGLNTAWMNRGRASWPDPLARPGCVVSDCAELARHLLAAEVERC
jgi:putative hydrolase of the HAD superfamily